MKTKPERGHFKENIEARNKLENKVMNQRFQTILALVQGETFSDLCTIRNHMTSKNANVQVRPTTILSMLYYLGQHRYSHSRKQRQREMSLNNKYSGKAQTLVSWCTDRRRFHRGLVLR